MNVDKMIAIMRYQILMRELAKVVLKNDSEVRNSIEKYSTEITEKE